MPDVEATFRPRLVGSGAFINNLAPRTVADEFMGGTAAVITSASSNANVGECNWNVADSGAGGDLRFQPSTAEMMGWYKLQAAATGLFGVYLGSRPSSSAGLLLEQMGYWEWRGTFNGPIFPNAVDGVTRFGFGQDAAAVELGDESLYVAVAPALSPFLLTGSRSGGVSTIRETTVRWVLGQVYDMRCVRVSDARFEFFIDQILRSEHDTADGTIVPPPGTLLGFMNQAEGGAADPSELGMDRFQFLRVPR